MIDYTFKIDGDKFMITLKNGDHEATYALDSSKKPKTIDLTLKGGDQDGKVMKGFFELRKMCWMVWAPLKCRV